MEPRSRRRRLLASGAAVVLAAAACAPPASDRHTAEFTGPSMGTIWTVKVVTATGGLDQATSRAIDRGIRDQLARIDQLMSTWDDGSELSRFNQSTDLEPFAIARETADVFRWAVAIAAETHGAFDPTVGPLVEAWGFGAAADGTATPDEATLERLRASVGMALVELDPDGAWVRKRRPEIQVDFSAIAPGYAADRIAEDLEARGLTDFLIDVSGELVARGRNASDEPWQVAIERPQATGRAAVRVVPLVDRAMATSGDYRNFREVDGQRLTHILDPRTARPVAHALASVTVIDDLAVRADALSTAMMVMGPAEAMSFAEHEGIPALFLIRLPDGKFEERGTPAFAALDPRP